MNKYDQKVLELSDSQSSIYELLQKKIRSPLFHFINLVMEQIPTVADDLIHRGAHYLIVNGRERELIHISPDLDIVTETIPLTGAAALEGNSFDFDGFRYKLFRRLK